jgi:hypothetical protein
MDLNSAAVALGRKRMANLTPEERSELSRKGSRARWGREPITLEQAESIRVRVAAGESRRAISKEYGVSPTVIGNIVRGRTYRTQ